METNKKIIVFYHANCTDGFAGAWAAWKKFGNTAEYLPYYQDGKPPKVSDKEIYMIDMVFDDKASIERLRRDNKRVTAIDHHKSSKELALSTDEPLFDNSHSGCVLAWKYFFPQKPVPKFLLAIEDVDLWNNKVFGSHELYEYLDLYDFDFKTWSKIAVDFENPAKRKAITEKGKIIFDFEKKIIERNIADNARLVKFAGHTVYAINGANFVSDVGAALCLKKPPFAIMWREKNDGSLRVSLRGIGNIDCAKIAAKYGGGGHKLSAAFRLASIKDIPWKPIN